ncbi:MAG: hypothetical protein JST58_01730 [Bacteroidetes bacterium]|nr:hypothetical protein [Bacteroidota bacterium]
MRNKSLFVILFLFAIGKSGFSQNRQKKLINTTKLELVYKKAQVTEYNYSGGYTRSFFVTYPNLRINDGKPVEVDRKGDILRNYFTNCPVADLHLDQMNQQVRRGRWQFWSLLGVGAVTAMSGVFATVNSTSDAPFWTRFGIGAGMMFTGSYLAYLHSKKADRHLRLAVDAYNSDCYHPLVKDTSMPGVANSKPIVKQPLPSSRSVQKEPSEKKYYQDSVYYELVRNEPSNSNLYGFVVNPFLFDLHFENINFDIGAGFFYTYKSLIGINVDYRTAYVDDLGGTTRNSVPYGTNDSWGIPANYKKASQANLLVKFTAKSWEKDGKYHLYLGTEKSKRVGPVTVMGQMEGKIVRALTVRAGYQMDNRIVESSNGMQFTTKSPGYAYNNGTSIDTLAPTNLSTSSAMQKAGIIVAGIGYSIFRDIKVKLNDDDYKGRREEKIQNDLYLDVLYASSLQLGNLNYYYATSGGHAAQQVDISSSPVNKLGWRVGYQSIAMYKPWFGWKKFIEFGSRPGAMPYSNQDNYYIQLGVGMVFGGRQ